MLTRSEPAGGEPRDVAPSETLFATWLTIAFVAATVPRLLTHELWRDEAWQWLVVRESHSIADLLVGQSRGGCGYLAPLLFFLASKVSTSPRAMQLAHLGMAAAATFVFARWAPFRRCERALFLLGYFPFYEYAVLCRNYASGELFLWLACVGAHARRPALAFGAAIGLLCQTTVYGYILAIALAGGWMLDRLLRRDRPPLPAAEIASGLALAVAGAVAGMVQLIPAPGTHADAPQFFFGWAPARALRVLAVTWSAFVPLPRPQVTFWNTNALDPWPGVHAAAGALMLMLAAALLWRSKVASATFAVGTTGWMVFSYLYHSGQARYQGHLWLLLVAAAWLVGGAGIDAERSWRSRVFLALLILQTVAGAYASWMDLRHPFSNGSATAELIRSRGLDRYPILGHREPPAATVSLYLGEPLYSPSRRVFVPYPDYGPYQRELSDAELRCAARELATREGRDVVLVINRELPAWGEIRPEGEVVGAIVASEDYHLYRLERARLGATATDAACTGEPAAR